MKVRLYRAKNANGAVDEFSLYFPHPKWMINEYKEEYGHLIKGCFLGCSQDSSGGVIRCCWEDLDLNRGFSIAGLGKRWPLEKMSEEFQAFAKRLEKIWNDALRHNDVKHWEIWHHS